MKVVKFTEEFLNNFFEDNFIEDENLFDCLKGREGTIEEVGEGFEDSRRHMMLRINLLLTDI